MRTITDEEILTKWTNLARGNFMTELSAPVLTANVLRLARWVEARLREGHGLKNQSGNVEHVFLVSSGFGANTQKPFIAVEFDGQILDQIPPEGARALAYNLIAAAEAAEQDAFLVSFMQSRVGLPLEQAAQVLGEFRQWRNGHETQESS